MWAPWLPANLTPFLNAWRLPKGGTPALNFQPHWSARLYSLLEGFRFHFVSLVGSIVGLVLWPARKAWRSEQQFRFSVFLAVLFFSLLGLHTWAGLGYGGINYGNAFTTNPYLAFFTYIGLLLTIAIFSNFQRHLSTAKQIIINLIIVVISAGIGYGGFDSTSRFLLDLHIPRIRTFFTTGNILPGYVPLWDYLANTFGITYDTSRWLIPLLSGLMGGLLVLLIGFAIWSFLKRMRSFQVFSFGAITVSVFMVAGILLSPSIALGGGFNQWDCSENVVDAYEKAGHYLAEQIPSGSTLFWRGRNAVAVLLYIPDIKIYPAQIDWEWNHWIGGNPDSLARLGFWNDRLAAQWLENADIVLTQNADEQAAGLVMPDFSSFSQVGITSQVMNCTPDSFLLIYRRYR
jgi:hypothetical protein